jgi:hypothetical protein
MVLFYEDEISYMKEYFEELISKGFNVDSVDRADDLLHILENQYETVDALIIDIMVFGRGNDFESKDVNTGFNSGIILLDEIEKLEYKLNIKRKIPKIVFTNRKGDILKKLNEDKRIYGAFRKVKTLPFEFLELVQKAIGSSYA